MPRIIKELTMSELIEDEFGEVDVEMLTVTANIAHHVGYRKVTMEPPEIKSPYEPYGEWAWHARYWAWEDD